MANFAASWGGSQVNSNGVSFNIKNLSEKELITMVEKMGDVAADAIKEEGYSQGVFDEKSNTHILENIKRNNGKVTKGVASCAVTFKGTQHGERNAAIAFINEFGRKDQRARPFISQALKKKENAILKAAEDYFWSLYENF